MQRTKCDADGDKCRNVKIVGFPILVRGNTPNGFHLFIEYDSQAGSRGFKSDGRTIKIKLTMPIRAP